MIARAPTILRLSRRGSLAAGVVGLLAALGLAMAGLVAAAAVLHGWLIAFAVVAGTALGCVAWLAVHGLTGGRWGEAGRPALLGGATALPLALLLALPLILAGRLLYPWAADPAAAGPGVAAHYLNAGDVALRSAALLGSLSVVGRRARAGALAPIIAALALVLYGALMNQSAFDWLLSLDPRYTSSAFGMQVIVAQMLSALCVVVLAARERDDDRVWSDYGGLMLACLLGEIYLVLMTLVVDWYGNLPDQAAWYLARTRGAWLWLEVVATATGAVGPGAALLFTRVRRSPGALRAVAVAILAGCVAEDVWLVAPSLGADAGWGIVAGLAALLACGGLALALAAWAAPDANSAKGVPDGA